MKNLDETVSILRSGGLVVRRTDTIYGVLASALDEKAVQRLRKIRKRPVGRAFIILASSFEEVARMVAIRPDVATYLKKVWPGKVSVVLKATGLKQQWLTESDGTVAFRVPADESLQQLLAETGPLCAPSANLPGKKPASDIVEAKNYFGDQVDLYVDGGAVLENAPSRLIKFTSDGHEVVLRKAAEDFIITRKRKLYKFARFDEFDNCFHFDQWLAEKDKWLSGASDICVEVGAGSALFSVELARRAVKNGDADKRFIAVDIKSDRLYRGARKATELGLKNIVFVRTDIARLGQVVPKVAASEIWLTFPDPYPRKSDAKHRLTAPRYLEIYASILKRDGTLNFKTDNIPLFKWSREQLIASGWKIDFETRDLHKSGASGTAKYMTTYEEKFVEAGLKVNCLRAFPAAMHQLAQHP